MDNRDFGIIPSFDANREQQKLNEMKQRTYHEQVVIYFLKIIKFRKFYEVYGIVFQVLVIYNKYRLMFSSVTQWNWAIC